MRMIITSILTSVLLAGLVARAAEPQPRILVFTRNGPTLDGKRGYVHDNIPHSVAAILELGAKNGFSADVTDDPHVFSDAGLSRYRAVVFSNTNNEILDTSEQKEALQRYIRSGGGYAGIHIATGSMRGWPWFWAMAGGSFVRHPKFQEFTIRVADRQHPSTAFLGETWRWSDEFYFLRDMPDGLHVLLEGDLSTLNDPQKPADRATYPLAWCHVFEGGRCWSTSLGHSREAYSDPVFRKHILGGILWAMGMDVGPE